MERNAVGLSGTWSRFGTSDTSAALSAIAAGTGVPTDDG